MAEEPKRTLEAIFEEALKRVTLVERAAYLDGACGDDQDLRARVEALLTAHDQAGSFLERPAMEELRRGSDQPGERIGPYKVLQLIGEGGFGAVYLAEQQEPVRRRVALKIIKLGMDTKQVIARFEAERQALAMLDHPNIAKVLDAGTTDTGRPYFVMELVRGIALNTYCDKNQLGLKERLNLFATVCRAVQHAHQKGIIHRDLKPGNVLVTLHDGVPVPKVIDFGIARATNQRLTEKTLFTEYGQFIGTPEYMSPEQAELSGLDIDTRSDIYSLGVILYELLTGTTPLDPKLLREAGFQEMQRRIQSEEPPIPSTRVTTLADEDVAEVASRRRLEPRSLRKTIRGDLDWIVMKALEKDRTRRYETATDLARDVIRHLELEPVLAGPPRLGYRLAKMVQRHRVGVLAGALVTAALLLGLGLATAGFVKARREANRSQAIADFLQDLLIATDPVRAVGLDVDVAGIHDKAREVFGEDHATVAATLTSRALQLQSAGNLAAAERLYREALDLWRHTGDGQNPNVAVTLRCLGTMLGLKGDDRGAEDALRESLALTADLPDEVRVVHCDARLELARLLMNRGAYPEAEELLRETYDLQRIYAPHHPLRVAITANTLLNVLVLAGDHEGAKEMATVTIDTFRRALPPHGLFLAKVLSQVGEFFRSLGDLDSAEACFREVIAIYEHHPDVLTGDRHMARRGLFYIVDGKDEDPLEIVERALDYVESVRTLSVSEALFGEVVTGVAIRIGRLGRPDVALPVLLEALQTLESGDPENSRLPDGWRTLEEFARDVAGRPSLPAPAYRSALSAACALAEHPDFGTDDTIRELADKLRARLPGEEER